MEVINALARRVLSGELLPGAFLPTEADLCVAYGVSRTVIRETAKVLEAKGLLSIRSRVGTQVLGRESWNLLDPDMIAWTEDLPGMPEYTASLMEARRVIEPAASGFAALRASAAHLEALESAIQRMRSFRLTDSRELARADADFHSLIFTATGNHLFMRFGKASHAALKSLFRRSNEIKQLDQIVELHQDVLTAIRARDADEARRKSALIIDLAAKELNV